MSEEDLKRAKREQDRLFQELEDRQRRAEELVKQEELAAALERAGIDMGPFVVLKKQLVKLGKVSGMSRSQAEEWAESLIVEALRIRLQNSAN